MKHLLLFLFFIVLTVMTVISHDKVAEINCNDGEFLSMLTFVMMVSGISAFVFMFRGIRRFMNRY